MVYAHINLDSQIGLQTGSSKSIAKDLSFIIYIEGKLLPSTKVSHLMKKKLLIHVHSLTCLLSPRQAHSDNISKSLFDITSFIDSAAEDIENDSTMDEVTTGKMLVLIEQFMTTLAVTLLTPILI